MLRPTRMLTGRGYELAAAADAAADAADAAADAASMISRRARDTAACRWFMSLLSHPRPGVEEDYPSRST
ncbi:hypothetical protein, partial [Clavibacter michiganensis]|uniref:hypothetical protein n=1 Tax=Clavibacter michiganensis TaxID=28447 RepID=UPI001C20AA07